MAAFRFKPIAGSAPRALTLTVTRFTPQAVLVANVEEARYDALVAEDGKTLIHARYAVRNNQRSFLAVTLPPGSTLWSATLAGRPIRPGLSAEGAVLLPLQKGRTGEEAPAFVVELVYLQRAEAWIDKGNARARSPGRGSAGLPHGAVAAPFAAIQGRAPSRDGSVSKSIAARGPRRCRILPRLPRRPRIAGASAFERSQGPARQVPEGGRPDDGRCHSRAGAFSATGARGVPRRGADRGNAIPFPGD